MRYNNLNRNKYAKSILLYTAVFKSNIMNEICQTIYEQIPIYKKEEFMENSPQLIIATIALEEMAMSKTDKWYLNYN